MLVRTQNNRFSNISIICTYYSCTLAISCLILIQEHAVGCQKDPASSADAQLCPTPLLRVCMATPLTLICGE